MKNLKSLEELKDLSLEDYNKIKDNFIEDAQANFEIYKGDLMYHNCLEILKASELVINSFTEYSNTLVHTKNDLIHSEVEKVSEIAINKDKELSKELNVVYKNSTTLEPPKNLKDVTDELIRTIRKLKQSK